MKFSFSDKIIKTASFLELCNIVKDYGFDGVEISNAEEEKKTHRDSIFRSSLTTDAKRKLVNRHISIPVICCPEKISDSMNVSSLIDAINYASISGSFGVIVELEKEMDSDSLKKVLNPAIESAKERNVSILLETKGALVHTEKVLDVINLFGSAVLGVCLNIKETFFVAKETADKTIQTLGAYIEYVRLGDKKDGKDCLIGSGELPVEDYINALRSLNYDGFVAVTDSGEVSSADILLTHFKSYLSGASNDKKEDEIYYNRSKTGSFPWKRYDVLDLTFSDVLDEMVERYPDQYAFKYTTLDYTRTYKEFREDIDRVAESLISLGVKAGHHVAIWATNVPEWFLTFWATVKIGAVLVTVNTAYKIHEAFPSFPLQLCL